MSLLQYAVLCYKQQPQPLGKAEPGGTAGEPSHAAAPVATQGPEAMPRGGKEERRVHQLHDLLPKEKNRLYWSPWSKVHHEKRSNEPFVAQR